MNALVQIGRDKAVYLSDARAKSAVWWNYCCAITKNGGARQANSIKLDFLQWNENYLLQEVNDEKGKCSIFVHGKFGSQPHGGGYFAALRRRAV